MPGFGGVGGSFPRRLGGAKPIVETITDALNDARGTGYDVTVDSTVWIDDHANARALASIWQVSEILANQASPLKLTLLLSRWEKVLGLQPDPSATLVDRRRAVNAIVSRTGVAPTLQETVDRLSAALAPITLTLAHTAPGDAGSISSWRGGWAVFPLGTTPPPVTLTGQPAATYDFLAQITTGGALGTALFRYTTDGGANYSAPIATGASVALGATGLTLAFSAGTYAIDNSYASHPVPDGFSSSVSRSTVVATKPTWMSESDYYTRTQGAFAILDDTLPAWVSFDVVRDGSVVGQFILDEDGNLDNQRLSAA